MTTGYVRVWAPEHPTATADGYAYEHRVVAWDAGMMTELDEVVHHLNGDRSDNRPENLDVARSHGEHMREHHRRWGRNAVKAS